LGMYQERIKLNKKGVVSFKYVTTFNMDEYVGLSEEHQQSYHYFMYHNFFNFIDIDKKYVNILNGNAKNLEKECKDYESKIKRTGGINLFVGGIGPDGHIAFNEPGSSLGSLTRVKTLTMDTIIANSRFFDNEISKVPKTALTVGVKTVLDSDEVMLIISGHSKSRALAKVVEEGVNHMWTVSALQLHPKGIIVCDDSSTVELKVGTVNYFKDIEAPNLDPDTLLKN
ncbi:MAG TPA: glucosamine-6-phosphate deaminase, partial [Ignavibacteriaceae bacterium]|nr:glucosamine-6-phosphate deaminase [Ignavibacteriaceae bacterium]